MVINESYGVSKNIIRPTTKDEREKEAKGRDNNGKKEGNDGKEGVHDRKEDNDEEKEEKEKGHYVVLQLTKRAHYNLIGIKPSLFIFSHDTLPPSIALHFGLYSSSSSSSSHLPSSKHELGRKGNSGSNKRQKK